MNRLTPRVCAPLLVVATALVLVSCGPTPPPPPPPKAAAPAVPAAPAFSWDNAIIYMEVSSKSYNYLQPWAQNQERKIYKSGVVVAGNQIITTADGLADQTLIRLKKQGAGLYSLGTIVWIDYQANLAVIGTDESDFWKGLQPAKLADPDPITGQVRIQRWRNDQLENRQGEIEQLTVDNAALSYISVPALRIDSTIPGVGWGEAVTVGDELIGLASSQGGDAVTAIPSSFIASILKARENKSYTGLGYFDFTWDPPENPLRLDYLKLTGPARGVILKETGMKPGAESVVKPNDVLLKIDDYDIDAEGNYRDPQYKKLSLEGLSSRKWAGQEYKFKIWRDGKEMDVVYKLPKADYADDLIPHQSFDQEPEYVMVGGFVFVPLTEAYLRSWGSNWRQRAPFRLTYYSTGKVKPERPQRVVLAQILPSSLNIGYEGLRNAVIDEINGVKIKQLSDIPEALKSPVNGFDIFKFAAGDAVREAVLDASAVDQANAEIMAHFYVPKEQVLRKKAEPEPAAPAPVPATTSTPGTAPTAAAPADKSSQG